MKPPPCPYCDLSQSEDSKCSNIRLNGTYYRTSDSTRVQKYHCVTCNKGFSDSTTHRSYRQKKRQKNYDVAYLLASSMSMRRVAKYLNINRKTVARIMMIEALRAANALSKLNERMGPAQEIQFDDMETFEHTKMKPLSITLVVEDKTRRIIGAEVSSMAANGLLAEKSRQKYGPRPDRRNKKRRELFERIRPFVAEDALIQSDKNPYYPKLVNDFFPAATYETFKGRKPANVGYNELKQGIYDPLFTLNHTAAMLRDNLKRLARKTWCTTKRADRLFAQILIYIDFHNSNLIPQFC